MMQPSFTFRPRLQAWVLAIAALSAIGCTVTFISAYDKDTDKGVTDLQRQVNDLFQDLRQTPMPAYASKKGDYDKVQSTLSSLRFRNGARPKNDITNKQLDALKKALDTFEEQHKSGTLNSAMLSPAQDILNQTFVAILKLELAKKELNETE